MTVFLRQFFNKQETKPNPVAPRTRDFSRDLSQPRSQGLSSLPSLVVGTDTLVAAGHVTIYPSKTAGWVGTQVQGREENPVAPPFQQIFLPPRFWVVT